MRKAMIFLVSLLACGGLALTAAAQPKTRYDATTKTCRVLDHGPLEYSSRAWGEGGQLFKKVCQGCHFKGNHKGADFLWTESKTSKAWNRVFAERYPKCAKDGAWSGLTEEQLMRINDYLYRWGKGSGDPGNGC